MLNGTNASPVSCSALLEKAIEQPFPCRVVYGRRVGQYAVEVEQNRVVIPGGERDDGVVLVKRYSLP